MVIAHHMYTLKKETLFKHGNLGCKVVFIGVTNLCSIKAKSIQTHFHSNAPLLQCTMKRGKHHMKL